VNRRMLTFRIRRPVRAKGRRLWPRPIRHAERCFDFVIVLLDGSRKADRFLAPRQPAWGICMKLISSLIICMALSACATDYVSQLAEPNYGRRGGLHYTEGDIDPALMMNGIYASKQMNAPYAPQPLGAFCLTEYGCTRQAPLSSSGWAP
jgi:hypothetical protein